MRSIIVSSSVVLLHTHPITILGIVVLIFLLKRVRRTAHARHDAPEAVVNICRCVKFVVTYDTRFKNILLLVAVFQDTPGAPLDVCVVSAITLESARATLAVPALLAALSDEV